MFHLVTAEHIDLYNISHWVFKATFDFIFFECPLKKHQSPAKNNNKQNHNWC